MTLAQVGSARWGMVEAAAAAGRGMVMVEGVLAEGAVSVAC